MILPQLAAAGVEAKAMKEATGWNVIWGPVYAKDIPSFIENGFKKTSEMHGVTFNLKHRIEMAVAWASPISLLSLLLTAPFWREIIPHIFLSVWILSLSIFTSFPLYSRRLNPREKSVGFIFFNFGRGGLQLILWSLLILGFAVYKVLFESITWASILRLTFTSFILLLILSLDLLGSTPIYKSGLHKDRLLKIALYIERCKGTGLCEQVCPRNCYELDEDRHITTAPRLDRCIQCGACIIQCPTNTLYFKTPRGEAITPDTIRRFKLNLLGKRLVKVSGRE